MTETVLPGSQAPVEVGGDVVGRRRFRPDIEGLRGVAVGVVVAFHVGVPGFAGGFVGVDVFVVISGFLITGHLLAPHHERTGRRLLSFYGHRAQRILPAATLTIIGTLVAALALQPALLQQRTAIDARAASLFVSNLRFEASTDYFQRVLPPSPFLQFWSLSLEEQFYLLWPVIVVVAAAVLAARTHRRASALLGVLAPLAAASFLVSWRAVGRDSSFAYFTLSSRAWEFLAGALLAALALRAGSPRSDRLRWSRLVGLAPWIGLGLIAIATVTYDGTTAFPGPAALLPVGGAVLVILGWHEAEGRGNPVLSARPLQLVGRCSYALYLWHWPVLILLAARFPSIADRWPRAAAVVVLVAVPLTLVTHHLVENPVRRSSRIRADWRLGVGMGAALVALSVGATYLYGVVAADGPFHAGRPAAAEPFDGEDVPATDYVPSNLEPELSASTRTDGPSSVDCPALGACEAGDPGSPTSVVLFGDSHAAEWTPALARIGDELGWSVQRQAAGACGSFLFAPLAHPTVDCAAWRADVLGQLAADPPDVVVLSNLSTSTYAADPDGWRDGVRAGLAALPAPSHVVVLSETPIAADDVPNCLATHLEDTRACEPGWGPELRRLNGELQDLVEADGGTFVDLEPWLCDGDRCPAVTGNLLVYADDSHLTEPFVLSRADALGEVLQGVLADDRSG